MQTDVSCKLAPVVRNVNGLNVQFYIGYSILFPFVFVFTQRAPALDI